MVGYISLSNKASILSSLLIYHLYRNTKHWRWFLLNMCFEYVLCLNRDLTWLCMMRMSPNITKKSNFVGNQILRIIILLLWLFIMLAIIFWELISLLDIFDTLSNFWDLKNNLYSSLIPIPGISDIIQIWFEGYL